jgi:hypothetical protein
MVCIAPVHAAGTGRIDRPWGHEFHWAITDRYLRGREGALETAEVVRTGNGRAPAFVVWALVGNGLRSRRDGETRPSGGAGRAERPSVR